MTATKKSRKPMTEAQKLERRNKMAERKEQKAQMGRIMEALRQEKEAFNRAIRNGAVIILDTAFGPYVVDSVNYDHDYHCHRQGHPKDGWNSRSFMGCNDGKWADLLRQANVNRVSWGYQLTQGSKTKIETPTGKVGVSTAGMG